MEHNQLTGKNTFEYLNKSNHRQKYEQTLVKLFREATQHSDGVLWKHGKCVLSDRLKLLHHHDC